MRIDQKGQEAPFEGVPVGEVFTAGGVIFIKIHPRTLNDAEIVNVLRLDGTPYLAFMHDNQFVRHLPNAILSLGE